MNITKTIIAASIAAIAMSCTALVQAEIYKCTVNGKLIMSDKQCAVDSSAVTTLNVGDTGLISTSNLKSEQDAKAAAVAKAKAEKTAKDKADQEKWAKAEAARVEYEERRASLQRGAVENAAIDTKKSVAAYAAKLPTMTKEQIINDIDAYTTVAASKAWDCEWSVKVTHDKAVCEDFVAFVDKNGEKMQNTQAAINYLAATYPHFKSPLFQSSLRSMNKVNHALAVVNASL